VDNKKHTIRHTKTLESKCRKTKLFSFEAPLEPKMQGNFTDFSREKSASYGPGNTVNNIICISHTFYSHFIASCGIQQ
jgi:hypothetical protein